MWQLGTRQVSRVVVRQVSVVVETELMMWVSQSVGRWVMCRHSLMALALNLQMRIQQDQSSLRLGLLTRVLVGHIEYWMWS